jgi:hypothetical protein
LLIVFERLRLASYNQSIKPLSRSLQPFQRINLYHTVIIRNCATLIKFYNSIKSQTTGLGQLVRHLHIYISEQRFHQKIKKKLAGIIHLVPNLRSIETEWSSTVGNVFLDQIRAVEKLEVVKLRTTSSKYIDLLEMENLQVVGLVLLGDDSKVENSTEITSNVRQLSLDKFAITVYAPSSLLIPFLQHVNAKDVTLNIEQGVDLMSRSLAALDSSITSQMTLYNSRRSPFILDSHLNRFTLLRHLSLGDGMTPNKSFFTAILATPLISLCLDRDFDLDAQSLIDALKDPTSSKELKKLQLDNIEVLEVHGYDGQRMRDCWTATCKVEHIDELKSMSQSCGYTIGGTTLDARKLWWEILAEREEASRRSMR